MKELVFNVKGMMCKGCENRVENALKNIDGIEDVKADHNLEQVKVTLSKDVNKEQIINKIEDIGYEVKED